ncbi:MAG: hypothetical protein RJQ09_00995 [Cyclobacteriaceae bacterium]
MNLFRVITLAACLITVFSVNGQDSSLLRSYNFEIGSRPNIDQGATTVFSATSLLFDQINQKIGNIEGSGLRGTGRVLNYTLVQLYLGGFLYGTFNHEYFGHGARAREFDIGGSYEYNFPAVGGDFVYTVDHSTSPLRRQMISAGGPEAGTVMAYKATQQLYSQDEVGSYIGQYLLTGKLFDGIFYINADVDPFMDNPNQYYSDNASYFRGNPVPDDPLSYLIALTESYGYYDAFVDSDATWLQEQPDMSVHTDNEFITDQNDRLKKAFTLSAIDPSLLYFLYGSYMYLAKGKSFIKPIMPRFGEISVMPSIRAAYGELGAENYFDMYFKGENIPPFNVYYRRGGNLFHHITGVGIDVHGLKIEDFNLGIQLDYWQNGREDNSNFNTAIKSTYSINNLLVSGSIGYKSKGVLIGKPLNSGFYGSVGLGFQVNYPNQN